MVLYNYNTTKLLSIRLTKDLYEFVSTLPDTEINIAMHCALSRFKINGGQIDTVIEGKKELIRTVRASGYSLI